MLPTGSRLMWIYSQGAITSREIMWMRRLEFAHSQERVQTDEDMDAFDLRSETFAHLRRLGRDGVHGWSRRGDGLFFR